MSNPPSVTAVETPEATPGPARARQCALVKNLPCDAVAALRAATRCQHEQLDRSLPVASAQASLADYAVHLIVLRDWLLALEPWLARALAQRDALALIAQDLSDCPGSACMSQRWPALELAALRDADDGSAAFCWGIAYVVEGSRLGGQVLYRRLREPLAPHPLRYLAGNGRTGPSWPALLALLQAQLAGPRERCAGCRGAVAAFEALVQRFDQAGCLA